MNRKMGRRIKVLVGGHDQKFWYPLQRELDATGKFEFREDLWTGHGSHDEARSLELLDWADVVLAEWTLGNAVFYAANKRRGQRLVTRLHLQERDTRFPAELDYSAVDAIVFVGEHILRECVTKFGIPREKAFVIGNFLDVDAFDTPKYAGSEFNLGMIGSVPARKRLDLAVDTLAELSRRDDRYVLHVKGPMPSSYSWLWARTRERTYYRQLYNRINASPLRHRVIFDPAGNDVADWFRQVGYLLSPSDFESFHMAIAEGMCSSTLPVVWNWEGAKDIYTIISTVSTPVEAADLIEFTRHSASRLRLAAQMRDYVRSNYSAAQICERWLNALDPAKDVYRTSVVGPAGNAAVRAVLVVWAIDNWTTFHRREMIEALARHVATWCDVLVVEPGSHFETLERIGLDSRAQLQSFLQLKPAHVSENIYRYRAITTVPPGVEGSPLLKQAQDSGTVVAAMIRKHFRARSLHWLYKPDQIKWVQTDEQFIYEVYDDYTTDFGTGKALPQVQTMEQAVLPKAAHVFFTSRPLAQRKADAAKAWSLVGNGVAYETFDRFSTTAMASGGGRKAVGYLGNLSDFFAWELLVDIASAMPEVDFILHGQIELGKLGERAGKVDALRNMSNVHFTGRVSRAFGAAAIHRYDALIIPFAINDAMDAVNPLKLWEYFVTGRPVVSTPMRAIEVEEPLVRFARSAPEWVEALRMALAEQDETLSSRRKELARVNSWAALTARHAEILQAIHQRAT